SLPRLREGGLDFVVAGALEMQSCEDLVHTELCTDEMVLVCRRGHPLQRARAIDDMLGIDWLWYSADTDCAELDRQTFARNGVPAWKHAVRCSSMTLVFSMLVNTDAVAFLPRRMLDPRWLQSILMCLQVPFDMPVFRLQIFTRRHALLSEPAQWLLDCLIDAARRGVGAGMDMDMDMDMDAPWPAAAHGMRTH
ncbi:MAG TPA: LysR substrate-binding domain-containing protein, partial [Pararobbsia sp.]|nr:LysR substrate-binding domain-containing protein [Pararobbsia sp.]